MLLFFRADCNGESTSTASQPSHKINKVPLILQNLGLDTSDLICAKHLRIEFAKEPKYLILSVFPLSRDEKRNFVKNWHESPQVNSCFTFLNRA